jgi:hypothetical protein
MKDFRQGDKEKIPVAVGGIGNTFHGGVFIHAGVDDLRLFGRKAPASTFSAM